MFADVAAEADVDTFCGLQFIRLQFAADRAAQLATKPSILRGLRFECSIRSASGSIASERYGLVEFAVRMLLITSSLLQGRGAFVE